MECVELSKISLYYGTIDCPKGFEIDRKTIKNSIIQNYVSDQTLSNNSKDLTHRDFKVDYSQPLQWLQDYIRDHFRLILNHTLVFKKQWGIVLEPYEMSYTRNNVDPVDLKNSPDYTLIYGVDIPKDSCQIVCHYNDNRRAGRTWHIPMENNKFVMFPSTQNYFISKNTSKDIITLLTITYEYI